MLRKVVEEAVCAKYQIRKEVGANFVAKQNSSRIWRGLVWATELLSKGLRWRVNNGKTTCFWKDVWVGTGPLGVGLETLLDNEQGK